MNWYEPLYLISAHNNLLGDADNKQRADGMRAFLKGKGYSCKQMIGCYKGERELSWLVLGMSDSDALALGRAYQQESIMHVDANRAASLIYCDGERRESLGVLRAARPGSDLPDAYTIDPLTGLVWVAS